MGVLPREIVKVLAQGGIPYAHANDMVNRISAEGQTSAPDFTTEYVSEEDWREGESDGTDLNPYGVPLSSSVPSFGSPFHKAPVMSGVQKMRLGLKPFKDLVNRKFPAGRLTESQDDMGVYWSLPDGTVMAQWNSGTREGFIADDTGGVAPVASSVSSGFVPHPDVPYSEASGKALMQYKVTHDIHGKPLVASSIYVRVGYDGGFQLKRK
jgi:hypothetical protein